MNHFLASLSVVLRKELIDGLRDRRSILSALVPSCLSGPWRLKPGA